MPDGAKLKLDFSYDHRSRRTGKALSTWNGSAYVAQSTNKFAYDDWNLLGELNHTNKLVRSYLWGSDLTGAIQGAGGVGGLLAINVASNGVQFAAMDANGNVSALLNATNGMLSAQYEYSPFGELLRTSGSTAKANPLGFSTKYQDDESDFLYYGFRYYNPSTGRWLNRDPLEEKGGRNLYGFVVNNPISSIDPVGLKKVYGNWCGSDWTGGQKYQYDPNGGPYLPPIDALDSACEKHDKCYFKCRQKFPCNPDFRSTCFRLCDHALTQAAHAFGGFWGKTVGAAIDRPGTRDPGPNSPCCNGSK